MGGAVNIRDHRKAIPEIIYFGSMLVDIIVKVVNENTTE